MILSVQVWPNTQTASSISHAFSCCSKILFLPTKKKLFYLFKIAEGTMKLNGLQHYYSVTEFSPTYRLQQACDHSLSTELLNTGKKKTLLIANHPADFKKTFSQTDSYSFPSNHAAFTSQGTGYFFCSACSITSLEPSLPTELRAHTAHTSAPCGTSCQSACNTFTVSTAKKGGGKTKE